MNAIVSLYSMKDGEIEKFLKSFFNTDISLENKLFWEKYYANPIEMADIIGVFSDNDESFEMKMWISFDKDIYVCISSENANKIIKYLYERYPY